MMSNCIFTARMRWRKQAGFTIIDLLIALAIIGVLTTLATGAFNTARRKTSRAEGRAALMQLMHQQERHYTLHHGYRSFKSDTPSVAMRRYSGSSAATSAYRMEAIRCPSQSTVASGRSDGLLDCILLRAVAMKDEADPACKVLTLDSNGDAGNTGNTGNATGCR